MNIVERIGRPADEHEALLIFDVRREDEYRVGHLRGAVRVDPGTRPTLPAGAGKDNRIVTYSSVGYRSSATAVLLME